MAGRVTRELAAILSGMEQAFRRASQNSIDRIFWVCSVMSFA